MCDCFTFIFHITFNQRSTLRLRWWNRTLLRLVRREAELKTTLLRFQSIQPCYLRFSHRFSKYILLKIPSTNESRLFPGSRHSDVKKKNQQSVVKWYEPKLLKIINFYLSYPLFLFFFSLFTFISHCFIIFLPSTFSGTHVRTVRTGSYAPDFVKNNFSLSKAQHD